MKAAAAEELASMGYDDDVQNIFLDSILSVSGHDPLYAEPCRMYARLRIEYTLSACPVSMAVPNLESTFPVFIASWV